MLRSSSLAQHFEGEFQFILTWTLFLASNMILYSFGIIQEIFSSSGAQVYPCSGNDPLNNTSSDRERLHFTSILLWHSSVVPLLVWSYLLSSSDNILADYLEDTCSALLQLNIINIRVTRLEEDKRKKTRRSSVSSSIFLSECVERAGGVRGEKKKKQEEKKKNV